MSSIDVFKKYRTRDGREVELYEIALYNSADKLVTFPVKGSYFTVLKSGKKRCTYSIWKLNGRFGAVGESPLDLIKQEE